MKKITLLLLLTIAHATFAQIPKPKKNTFVNDYAGVLADSDIQSLNQKIKKIETNHGVQLAIVLVNKIPAEYDIQEFSLLIGRRWKVGTKQRGLVYVAAIKQRKQRIEVARNLDATFPTSECSEILESMKGSFKRSDYYAGLTILVNNIDQRLAATSNDALATATAQSQTQAKPQPAKAIAEPRPKLEQEDYTIVGILAVLIIGYLTFRYIRNKRRTREMQNFYAGRPGSDFGAVGPAANSESYSPRPQNYSSGYSSMPGPANYSRPGYSSNSNSRGSAFRNVAAGAIGGAIAGYAARAIQDKLSEHDEHETGGNQDNRHFYQQNNDVPEYGNWGADDSGSNDSSYDSGFSDSDSSDSESSSGATSDW